MEKLSMSNECVTNAKMYNCVNNIIFSYYNCDNKKNISTILVELYNDLYGNINDNTKYAKEPFVVRKMVEELKKIEDRKSVLRNYAIIIQRRLEQPACFDIKFQESLKKAITEIDTLKKGREFQQSLEGAIANMGTPENSL